jgi:hypothetical protein
MKVRSRRPLLAAATAIFAVLMLAAPVLADLTFISGYAYGESVNVTVLAVNVQSGPLPESGPFSQNSNFTDTDSALDTCVFTVIATCNVLSAGTLNTHTDGTIGPTGSVNSTASAQTVNALTGVLTGTVIASQCAIDSTGAASGSSTLTTVVIQGVAVAANPGPNTVVNLVVASLIVGTVTLNEQDYNAGTNTLTVNAIHIRLNGGSLGSGDIIISHVECDSVPAGPAPVVPESPLTILLPLSALLVGGGILLVVLRRQQTLQAR